MSRPSRRLVPLVLTALAAATPAARACETCAVPGSALAPPTAACQVRAGSTDDACPTRVFSVDLVAGETYVFTLCDATCSAADADFDSRLRVYSPACAVVAENDDWCGSGRSQVTVTPTVTGPHAVEVTGSELRRVGDFSLGYFKVCREGDCVAPNGVLGVPTTTCQTRSDDLGCGATRSYRVDLTQGQTYTFTLCGATCPGAGADFDAGLELVGPTGTVVASSSAACGDDGEIVHATDPATGGGAYCVRVLREAGTGGFTLGWRVACQPPSDVALSPLLAGATSGDCTLVEELTATTAGTGPFTWDWEIAAPPGASAVPSRGTVDSPGGAARFTTVLTGVGAYLVTVSVTNDCGTAAQTFDYLLEDRLAPSLGLSARPADCGSGFAAPRPASAPPLAARSPGATSPAPDARQPSLFRSEGDLALDREAKLATPALEGVRHEAGAPGFRRPPEADALGCLTPCTGGFLEADHPFYDVFLNCGDGSFTARTGAEHPVTLSSGARQNVIFGGAGGGSSTSDVAWRLHDLGITYQDPGLGRACVFDPPDTPAEPNSIGLEAEWVVSPEPGVEIVLREEIVAFGTSEADSGIRLSLGATAAPTNDRALTMGVRWQIDYQNASDDGPLFAMVTCEPPEVVATLDAEHELAPAEVEDFYRIQNNTGSPIFANYTNTTAIAGFPDTGTPDRLVFGYWPSMVGTAWDRPVNEGDTSVDFDSAVHYTFGHLPADGIPVLPGESFRRSVVIFTSGDSADCGGFVPGEGGDADLVVCAGECAELSALASDACGGAEANLVGTSPGAPPCGGNPCTLTFADPGTHVYEWEAVDDAGNVTRATTLVTVLTEEECGVTCVPTVVAPPESSVVCLGGEAVLDASGLGLANCDGDVVHEWTSAGMPVGTGPVVTVTPDVTTDYEVVASCSTDPACAARDAVRVTVERPPLFMGARARDVADCSLGVEVSWDAAVFRDPTASGVYNVYRSEIGCADALAGGPVATGLTDLRWLDLSTREGSSYVYVVEAEDNRAGTRCVPAGAHHGGAAERSCTAPVVDVGLAETPAGVFRTLRAKHEGHDVTFAWDAARDLLPGEHFHLLKASGAPTGSFALVNGESDRSRAHSERDTASVLQFFDLRVANACEEVSPDEYPSGFRP